MITFYYSSLLAVLEGYSLYWIQSNKLYYGNKDFEIRESTITFSKFLDKFASRYSNIEASNLEEAITFIKLMES